MLNTWQIWDALGGGWWWNSGPGSLGTGTQGTGVGSLADYLVDFPDATIENAPGTGLGGIRFNVGFASDTDQFNGYVDKFTIGVAGDADKTFNFDPDAVTADAPEPASLALLALGLAGLGFSRRKQT